MAGLDVYVQPSVEEGFGLALVEAMAMRLPVVATAVGGMLATVEPDRSGLRVPPADPAALADAIVALLEDPARAAALGKEASERVRANYSITRMMTEYDRVYRAALESAP
jgi:glycosyltransferase involved in cell wall biosynthesis